MNFIRLTLKEDGLKINVNLIKVDCITEYDDYSYIAFEDGDGIKVVESGQTIRNRIKSLGGNVV